MKSLMNGSLLIILFFVNCCQFIKSSAQTYSVNKAHHVVSSKKQFLNALKEVKENEIIYIEDDATIDLTGLKRIQIPSRVKIVSGRGVNGSKGGMISTSAPAYPLFLCGESVTFSGIRVQGPDTAMYHEGKIHTGINATRLNARANPVSKGIVANENHLRIENCELFGWTHSAVVISSGVTDALIINNYIHHNRRFGLGYGITVDGGFATIKNNVFDYNRHDIAGTGAIGSGYEATNNTFLENTYSHSVDMHGGRDRNDNTDIAGTLISVHNNVFRRKGTDRAVRIRGVPQEEAHVYNNVIEILDGEGSTNRTTRNRSTPISTYIQQINAKGNLRVYNNTVK